MTGTETIALYLFFLLAMVISGWRHAKRNDVEHERRERFVKGGRKR